MAEEQDKKEDQFGFTPEGEALDYIGLDQARDNNRVQVIDSNGRFLGKWDTKGRGDGQFWSPTGIAVGGAGNIYVGDSSNHRVQVFAPVCR
jgi:DNA-binding beta-propeller fold protein YncE